MRITYVSEYFPVTEQGELRGGAEARVFYIVQELAKRHDITILSSMEEHAPRETRLFGGQLRVLRVGPMHRFVQSGSLTTRVQLIRALRLALCQSSGDILDAQNFLAYWPSWYGRTGYTKAIMTVHDVWRGRWLRLFGPFGLLGEVYERYVISRPWDGFIANSNMTKQRLLESGVRAERIVVIYNGITQAIFRHEHQRFADPTVVYVGRLVQYKRVQDLLEAFAIVQKKIPNATLFIIGIGPYRDVLTSRVRSLSLRGVSFLGHIPRHEDVLSLIAKSHIFCLPSVIEGFGMVTMEAMALGVPYVNADLPITREVADGKGGLLFQPKNVQACADCIIRLLRHTPLHSRLSEEATNRAKMFLWSNFARQTEEFYRQILDGA